MVDHRLTSNYYFHNLLWMFDDDDDDDDDDNNDNDDDGDGDGDEFIDFGQKYHYDLL